MQYRWPWFERKFNFDFPPQKMPDIVERLRGTTARAALLVEGLTDDQLEWREQPETWSIKENLAHLADLEPLWVGRIQDILAGVETMRDADLTNTTTRQAGHNAKSLDEILKLVTAARESLLESITSLDTHDYSRTALHPRLKQPMRIVDLCLFVADHDDYHLARVRYLREARV